MWFLCITVGFVSMFSVTMFYHPSYVQTRFGNAMYAGLHRLGWSLSIGWLLMACVANTGGVLKRILASRGLVPFSRLTYCAFLTNGLVELYMAGSVRKPLYMGTINLVRFHISLISFYSPLLYSLDGAILRSCSPNIFSSFNLVPDL